MSGISHCPNPRIACMSIIVTTEDVTWTMVHFPSKVKQDLSSGCRVDTVEHDEAYEHK